VCGRACAICLLFQCLVLCILSNANVHKLYDVSLSAHSSPKWTQKVGWSIVSSCSLHNCHLLSVSSFKILFLKWFVLNAWCRVATIVLSVSHLMSPYCSHQYDCSLSTIFFVYYYHHHHHCLLITF